MVLGYQRHLLVDPIRFFAKTQIATDSATRHGRSYETNVLSGKKLSVANARFVQLKDNGEHGCE